MLPKDNHTRDISSFFRESHILILSRTQTQNVCVQLFHVFAFIKCARPAKLNRRQYVLASIACLCGTHTKIYKTIYIRTVVHRHLKYTSTTCMINDSNILLMCSLVHNLEASKCYKCFKIKHQFVACAQQAYTHVTHKEQILAKKKNLLFFS